jgi:hypothetical protein
VRVDAEKEWKKKKKKKKEGVAGHQSVLSRQL